MVDSMSGGSAIYLTLVTMTFLYSLTSLYLSLHNKWSPTLTNTTMLININRKYFLIRDKRKRIRTGYMAVLLLFQPLALFSTT